MQNTASRLPKAITTLIVYLVGDTRFIPTALTIDHLEILAQRLGASISTVAKAMGIAPSTAYRALDGISFGSLVSDRLYRVAIIVAETMLHYKETPRTLRSRGLAFARDHLTLLATYDGELHYRTLLTRTKP